MGQTENKVESKVKIKELIDKLNEASAAYYKYDNPIISDKQYDDLYSQLETFEQETGIVMSNSPTRKVQGEILEGMKKVKHIKPMLSANKTKDINVIKNFIKKGKSYISWKLDGCFTEDTPIIMSDGTRRPIKDIKVGDDVLSFNEKTNEICISKVTRCYNNGMKENKEWTRIKLFSKSFYGNQHIVKCTKNHLFFTENGWVQAKNIKVNDEVLYYDYILSKIQEQVLLGILLGDGSFVDRRTKGFKKQLEIHYSKTIKNNYFTMIEKINELFKYNNPKIGYRTSGYSKTKNNMADINLHSILVPDYIINKNNQLRCGLTFTEEICHYITPLTLALLHIDDGYNMPSQINGYKTKNVKNRCTLHTNRHKKESVELFIKYLNSLNISCSIKLEKEIKNKNLGDGYIILIDTKGTEKFYDLIAPYIPKELRKVKLGLKDKWQNAKEVKWWDKHGEYGLINGKVTLIGDVPPRSNQLKNRRAYDLEVENTHTYFANNFAVHNCTLVASYKNGKFTQALTRGNGEFGEDVTSQAKMITNLPLQIPYKGDLELRGECVVSWDNFNKINEQLEEPFSHPRNLAAGTIRNLNTNIVKDRFLEFIVFEVVNPVGGNSKFIELNSMDKLGFTTVDRCSVTVDSIDVMIRVMNPQSYDYPVDGLIFEYDDIEYSESLGSTGHHPLDMIALKFTDEIKETTLKDIEWNTSRTGLINPVAIFEPIEIEGSIVGRATLHNISIIEELELGIGDVISVYKANKIIPKIDDNLTRSNTFTIPHECPNCGGETEVHNNYGSKTLHCLNENCPAKLINKLIHFTSRNAMNIEGLSEATLEKFVSLGFIQNYIDIYHLEQYKNQIINLEGFGIKSYNNLISSINKSRNTTPERLLYALSIPNGGRSVSKLICKRYNYDWNKIRNMSYPELIEIDGIGDVIANSYVNYFYNQNNQNMANELVKELIFEDNVYQDEQQKLSLENLIFVITGSVNQFKNREELKQFIESKGGKVSGSVSSKTNFLINNDNTSNSSKNKKAKELSVKIITEDEFLESIK